MGTWGTALYENDTTKDIRAEYVDKLRLGKTNKEATKELVENKKSIVEDEEEALFWFALADTQWDYGRLLPEIKEKALWFLSRDFQCTRWEETNENNVGKWNETLKKLENKLHSLPPPPKKVSQHRLFQCPWKLGDVFAYCFSSEYSDEKGLKGQYVLFRKVSEDIWHPGHIVPVVEVYNWFGETIPQLKDLHHMSLLPAFSSPEAIAKHPYKNLCYRIKIISESEKTIPHDNLFFVGNLNAGDLTPFRGNDFWTGYGAVGWKKSKYNNKFEQYVIDTFLAWHSI